MGVFIKQGNQWIECKEIEEGGSTNDDLQSLGYDHNQFYSYTNYNQPHNYGDDCDDILSVCFKVMTEDIICVIASPGRKALTEAEVSYYLQDFDFARDYSRYSMECDLESAIAEHNFTIQFVADALGLPFSPEDKVLHSNRFKYNFFFEGGFLTGYEISDGYNREAHEMKEQGSWIYQLIESHAINFHGANNDDVVKEINIQANAFQNIPGGITNQYKDDFKNSDGSYNFKMLLVARYQGTEYESGINYEDCKCICHQELKFEGDVEEGLDKLVKYRYRDYIITFDEKGKFVSCEYSHQQTITPPSNSSSNNSTSPSSSSGCVITLLLMMTSLLSLASLVHTIV